MLQNGQYRTSLKFAAFIMTYERPEKVVEHIEILLKQSFSPELILVVDNSHSLQIQESLEERNFAHVKYIRVGYNSGPAGASKIALQQLTALNYDWIYWGDDDNPPSDHSIFENFFIAIEKLNQQGLKLGIFSGKGGSFNKFTGRVLSFNNKDLSKGKYIEADAAPGGHTLLVNARVVKEGILPNEKLFFGFEELDFCFKVRKKGFKVFVNAENWLALRAREGNIARNYRWKASTFGNRKISIREYYSLRNLLNIYFKNGYYIAFAFLLFKSFVKMFVGFYYGYKYGKKMFHLQKMAILDFFSGNFGKKDGLSLY